MLTTKPGSIPAIAVYLLVAVVGAAGLIAPFSSQAASIKVVVNGSIITSYDIAQRTRLFPLFGVKGGEKKATEDLIDETLKIQEAERLRLNVPNAQINAMFAAMGKDKGLSPAQLARELGRIGINADSIKRWIRAQITWRELVKAKVRHDSQVKNEDVMAAMLEKKNEDKATQTDFQLQQIIFVVPSGSSKNYVAQRRREAEGFRIRFPGCEDSFAQAQGLKDVVVRNLGRRETGQLRGPQGDEIKKTEAGKTTKPFVSDKGVELIAVCSRRDFQSDSAIRNEVETELKFEQAKELGEDYLKELRDKAIIQYR
jgi:peptidyl-prolyl cis-trans isomerase SurA